MSLPSPPTWERDDACRGDGVSGSPAAKVIDPDSGRSVSLTATASGLLEDDEDAEGLRNGVVHDLREGIGEHGRDDGAAGAPPPPALARAGGGTEEGRDPSRLGGERGPCLTLACSGGGRAGGGASDVNRRVTLGVG